MSETAKAVVPKRRGRPPKMVQESIRSVEAVGSVGVLFNKAYPEQIIMQRPFGYICDDGQGRAWPQGTTVDDPDEIKDIIDRGWKDWI